MKTIKRNRHLVYLLSGIAIALASQSCSTQGGNETPSESVPKETVEEAVVNPSRSENFYERMLETFCQQYYNDCFSRCKYKSHSLLIERIAISRDHNGLDYVETIGHHACGGLQGNNHIEFTATIIEKESNYFEITFKKDKYLLGKIIGKESGTRTMHYVE